MSELSSKDSEKKSDQAPEVAEADTKTSPEPKEVGGRKGPEPTRYGDWEKNGIISDF